MAVDTMIFDKLYNIIFGDQQQAWAEADDAGRQQMLEDEGLDQLTPEDLHEAVTLMSEELPPEQVSLLAPSTTSATAQAAATTALADQDVSNADTTVRVETFGGESVHEVAHRRRRGERDGVDGGNAVLVFSVGQGGSERAAGGRIGSEGLVGGDHVHEHPCRP